jgi:hypothetical protein
MITDEEGPFGIFSSIRRALGGESQKTWLGRGIVCHWCVSVWVSGVLNADRDLQDILAISAGSIILDELLSRRVMR